MLIKAVASHDTHSFWAQTDVYDEFSIKRVEHQQGHRDVDKDVAYARNKEFLRQTWHPSLHIAASQQNTQTNTATRLSNVAPANIGVVSVLGRLGTQKRKGNDSSRNRQQNDLCSTHRPEIVKQ